MGVKKINSILTAKGLAQLPKKVVAAMATEGVTEGLQEGVVIGADALGGKEFKDNEIFERLKEASIAGAAAGGTIRTGTASCRRFRATAFCRHRAKPRCYSVCKPLQKDSRSITITTLMMLA